MKNRAIQYLAMRLGRQVAYYAQILGRIIRYYGANATSLPASDCLN